MLYLGPSGASGKGGSDAALCRSCDQLPISTEFAGTQLFSSCEQLASLPLTFKSSPNSCDSSFKTVVVTFVSSGFKLTERQEYSRGL